MLIEIKALDGEYYRELEESKTRRLYINPQFVIKVEPFDHKFWFYDPKNSTIITINGNNQAEQYIVAGNYTWWAKKLKIDMLIEIKALDGEYYRELEESKTRRLYINPQFVIKVEPSDHKFWFYDPKNSTIITINGNNQAEQYIVAGNYTWWAKKLDFGVAISGECDECDGKQTVRFYKLLPGSPYVWETVLKIDEEGFSHYKCVCCKDLFTRVGR